MPGFEEWESFYLIVGTAAAALIGLQFVVMTLIAERPQIATPEAGAAFATPTVVHFGAVLLVSVVLRAPWQTITTAAVLWGVLGLAGIVYGILIVRRMRRQTMYQPDLEDRVFHVVLPVVGYAVLVASALAADAHAHEALFGVGAAAVLLLFVGIHNVWDTVAYQVFVNIRKAKE